MVFRNFLGENRRGATYASLTDLLSVSDIVSLHLPYSRDTHHVIGSRELSLMKNTAFLINTSRGRNVDELALIEALEKRVIAGAGLDVFHDEPAIPEKLKKLS
ncbi:MAG TPA: NAD(P)-dependent oxidoreductase, partial [Candidatus Hodarchaeales archaeon]|nr:NAD(P)-dependent oxidoreductase [Candidatus Hodarchaeales archaeon]